MTIFNQSMLSILVYVYNISSRINIFRPHCSGPLCLCVYLKFNLKKQTCLPWQISVKKTLAQKVLPKSLLQLFGQDPILKDSEIPRKKVPGKKEVAWKLNSIGHLSIFLKKWANPGLFYHLFLVFPNKYDYKFYNKYMWKMSIRCWDSNPWPSEHDH